MKPKKAAVFPFVMTVLAGICFLVLYLEILRCCLTPLTAAAGLPFALPCLVLGILTLLTHREWLAATEAIHLTLWVSVFSVFSSFWYCAYLIFHLPME